MHRRIFVLPLALGLAACVDQLPTAPDRPAYDIADAARAYKSGFYWLPPVVKQPAVSGTFDADLSPTVQICELVGSACGSVIATFSLTDGANGELLRLNIEEGNYQVNWHTNEFALSAAEQYRVSVRAGVFNVLLGYTDVQPVSNGSELKNVDTNEYIGLKDGRTLPIKFRIETGVVGQVEVQPVDAEVAPGATQQFVPVLRDLHGNLMSGDVVWTTSAEAVATIGQNGLASAVADGVATITATAERISGNATLTVVGGVILVTAGNNAHSCALTPAGKAYCWGLNSNGQLGNGTTINTSIPVAVATDLVFRTIAAGQNHTCALTIDSKAWCWGRNNAGQLGDGTFALVDKSTPSPVFGNRTFAHMGVGPDLTCAVTPTGEGFCWGADNQGNCVGCAPLFNPIPVPQQPRGWVMIVPGSSHTCGLTTSGLTWCWGLNTGGELGAGSPVIRSGPLQVVGGHVFTTLTLGQSHTCALTAANQAYCWGFNPGAAIQRSPVAVVGGHSFMAISAGRTHTCALSTDGAAYCWGNGTAGRLGQGPNMATLSIPAAVVGGLIFESIEAGDHTCALTPSHQAYCWGPGAAGQLGNGANVFQSVPTPIAPLPD